ncbi:MAG: 30S ribosome-binding factor RbfA [Bacteroidota bacterium]|nr:30S ribosome-binding factor RbfA [Bacteroidota bacterium]
MTVRVQRVSRMLQREIADILAREVDEAHMITVTEARVTRDLSIVEVHVSVFGSTAEQRADTFRLLQRRTAYIRGLLGRRIRHQLRAVPIVHFQLDESPESVRRMDALFDQIRKERRMRPDSLA